MQALSKSRALVRAPGWWGGRAQEKDSIPGIAVSKPWYKKLARRTFAPTGHRLQRHVLRLAQANGVFIDSNFQYGAPLQHADDVAVKPRNSFGSNAAEHQRSPRAS